MTGMISTVIYPGCHIDKMDLVNVLDTYIMAVFLINTSSHNTVHVIQHHSRLLLTITL